MPESRKKRWEFIWVIILVAFSIVVTYCLAQYLFIKLGNWQYVQDNLGINLEFLKGVLTGLGGNLITFVVFLSISSLVFFARNFLPRRDLINFFGITQRNTRIIILLSKVKITGQIAGRETIPLYPGYSGDSLVQLEYNAAKKIQDKFTLDKPLISFQKWFNILESSFLEFKNISVEIHSCPDEEKQIEKLFDAADAGRTSLIIIGSPVNNQFAEVLFFRECKGRRISPNFLNKIESFMERMGYSDDPNSQLLMPLRFKEYDYDKGGGELAKKFDVRINHDDSEDEKGQYCGFIQRIPLINQQTRRAKSTITVFAGWNDLVTELTVDHFIKECRSTEIKSLAQNREAFPVVLFKADDGVGDIFDRNRDRYRSAKFPLS